MSTAPPSHNPPPSTQADRSGEAGRVDALRQATRALHDQVDAAMMALRPFGDREGYKRFLAVQYRFHQRTASFYADATLNGWFPGLAARERREAVEQDCRDLGLDPAEHQVAPLPLPQDATELALAVGWLYVNEGSNLGAAFLYKHAQKMGLDGQFGARHLAAHAEGRAAHWHAFVAQLEAAPLTPAHDALAVDGAQAAFQHVIALARAGQDA